MRWITFGALITALLCGVVHAQVAGLRSGVDCHTTLFGGTTCSQPTPAVARQPAPITRANTCRFGSSAPARLMCADPTVAAVDLSLAKAYRSAMQGAMPDQKKSLQVEQAEWIRQRNQECGLAGKDNAPLDQIRPAAQCMKDEIKERIDALQREAQKTEANNSNNANNTNVCQSAKGASERLICADPDLADANLALSKAYQDAEKAASVDDKARLAQEQLAWLRARDERCGLTGKDSAPIDELRKAKPCMEQAMKVRFAALLAASNGKSASSAIAASPGITTSPVAETTASIVKSVSGSTGLQSSHSSIAAQSVATPVETELSRARQKFAADLGIQQWIDSNQLARNPYFYQGQVVGMVLSFKRSISKNEAVFVHDDDQVFVTGVPLALLQGTGELVLAGRVRGNKGVIDPSGNEAILPALDYVGGVRCASLCAGLAKLAASEKQPYPTAGLEP